MKINNKMIKVVNNKCNNNYSKISNKILTIFLMQMINNKTLISNHINIKMIIIIKMKT